MAKHKAIVVILHGGNRTSWSMRRFDREFRKLGFDVSNKTYISYFRTVSEIAYFLSLELRRYKDITMHFVGFSLGSIIIRVYLHKYKPKNIGRFVMIAPPNHGSEYVEKHKHKWWFKFRYGKVVQELGTSNGSILTNMLPPPCDYGIIAGGKGDNVGFSKCISGDNDGTISVASTLLPNTKHFSIMPYKHNRMLRSIDVVGQTSHFILNGSFITEIT